MNWCSGAPSSCLQAPGIFITFKQSAMFHLCRHDVNSGSKTDQSVGPKWKSSPAVGASCSRFRFHEWLDFGTWVSTAAFFLGK